MLSAQEKKTPQREHLQARPGSNHSPWLSNLLQIGSTCMNGPSFWRSCNSSARYWLRHRNPIQPRDTREIEAEIRRRPRGQERERSNLLFLPRNPPNLNTETYLPTSGGPGGLTCGDMARPGAKQASVPCRPSMAAGRMGPPLGANRESPDGRRWRGRWCVCVYRLVSLSFSRCGGSTPFLENLSKTLPCAALRTTSTRVAASPASCALAP
jgi:hypothetical protein